ncbi:LPD38 domain-containing protein [Plesiomonas shigelloides]|uniref:LPD38 domain-containing protein n=1 Tax=Plesiomonas shigelloides TaxID=703 RepID=UPI00057AA4C1|nr:LPD38 domain-containing protein [Plesiomonas shigelloides]
MRNDEKNGMPSPVMSDTRMNDFWNNLDANLLATPSQAEAEPKNLSVGFGDAVKAVGAGALDLVGGIGEVARQASAFGKKNGDGNPELSYADQSSARMAKRLSPVLDAVAGVGNKAHETSAALVDSMSDDAKEALNRSIISENEHGGLTLGDGAGDIDVWSLKFANGLGSMLPTMIAGGITGIVAMRTLGNAVTASMLKRGASKEIAEAVAEKTVEKLATGAVGATAITGSVGSAGLNAKETIHAMSFDELRDSFLFREAFLRIDANQQYQGLSDFEKLSMARDEVANLASAAAMGDVKTWGAAAVGSLLGDTMLFKMLVGKGAKGFIAGAAKGAAGEGIGEMLEEGTQQYAVNEAVSETTGIESDPWKGVLSSAIEGGLIGAGTGGAIGAVGGARSALGERKANQSEDASFADGMDHQEGDSDIQQPEPLGQRQEVQTNEDGGTVHNPRGTVDASNRQDINEASASDVVDMDIPAYLRQANKNNQSTSEIDPRVPEIKPYMDTVAADGFGRPDNDELNPLGTSNHNTDNFRDVPSFIRNDPDKARFKQLAEDSDVQRALSGEFGPNVQEMIAVQMRAGEIEATLSEAQARKPFDNKLERELNPVVPYQPEGEVITAKERADVLANGKGLTSKTDAIDGDYAEVIPKSHRIEKSGVIYANGEASPSAEGNSAYVPPVLARNQPDTSMDTQSTRDPRSDVAKAIDRAGEATDSVFGPLKTMRITRRGKPFASQKEAQMASRKGIETPVELNGGGYGVAEIAEVVQAKVAKPEQAAEAQEAPPAVMAEDNKTQTTPAADAGVSVSGGSNTQEGTPLPWSSITKNQDGTATLIGDPATLKRWAKENGIRTITRKDGVLVAKSAVPKLDELTKSASVKDIEAARTEVNVAPTDAQKEAGNYKKGHVKLQGLDITLENPKGSVRSGTDATGKAWQSTMAHDYGYIKRTEGADGDHVDVFIGDNPESQNVYVIDQRNTDGTFDEHKVMLGFDDEASARAGYLANYSKGWKGLGDVRTMTMNEFKGWLTIGDTTKPATQAKIGDFGDKLGGARKDVWNGYQDKLEGNSADQIAKLPLSRSWPAPDYQALIDGGMDTRLVALMRAMREAVPTKPRTAYRVSSWAASVKSMRDLSVSLMNGELTPSQIEMAAARSSLRHSNQIGTKADLYEAVGHKVNLSDIALSQGHYSLHNGVHYDPPKVIWQISKQSNATAFSTWPRVLASGDSKADVLSSFKSSYQSLLDNSRDKPRETSFDIYSSDRRKTWVIGKKIGRNYVDLAGPFDNVKDARGYRDAHQDKLEEKLKKTKEIPRERRDINQPRVGEDMRGGIDVTPELFTEAFGFRGVEFGNWVEQARRQKDLNDAYDALMDMAAVIGVSPKALSLNGELGLAFGARGNGGVSPAAAHYEPGKIVINLTKKNGAGSLGHEWWHAMDNYFARMREDDGYMTEARDVERSSRQGKYIHVGEVRREMIDAFGAVKRSIDQTSIQARSAKLDSKRSKAYWGTLREMSARAFESYLIAKLQDQQASNDYLANIVSNEAWDAESALGIQLDESYPYPTAGEIPGVRAAFDHFFDTIQEKEVDGKRVLYSRNDSDTSGSKDKATAKPSSKGMTKKEVELIAKGFVRQYKGAANILVTVVQTQEEANKLAFGGLPEGYKVHAFYQGNGIARVVLVADNLTSAKHALQKMRHEVLVHHGFQAVIGDVEYGRILRVLWDARDNKSLKPLWDHVQDVERDTPLDGQLEELLAYVAEKPRGAVGRFVDRIVGMVAQALRKVGFISKVTEAELRNIVEAIGDRMKAVSIYADKETDAEENRKNKNSNVLKGSMVKFSRARTAQDIALEKLNLGPRKDPIQTLKSRIDEMKSRPVSEWKKMADDWMKRMNSATFDALAPLKYAEDKAGNIAASDSAYIAARLATGSASTMHGAMLYGVPEWKEGIVQMKQGTSEKESFLGIFESVGSDLHTLLGWIAGNRAKRLKTEGRENLLTDDDIDALIAGAQGKEAKFEDARKRLMAMNDALLDMAEGAGLISHADRKQWQDNDWYIPFYREDDDGDVLGPWKQKGLAGQRAMIKKLKGGKQNTNDLLENILVNASKLIDSAMKNMAMQKAVWNLAETDVIEVISKPNLMDIKAAMSPKGNKSLLSMKMEGEDYVLRIHDEQLFKALTAIDQQRPDHPGLGLARAAKRLLTATVTAMPDFMLRNFIRDAMQAWTMDKNGFKFGLDSLRGIKKTWREEGGTLDMLFAGGSFMGGYMNDTESMASSIRRALRKKGMTSEQIAKYERSLVTSAIEAKERLAGAWEKYRSVGDAIENANREAVYDAAIRAGKSKAEAIFEAKDLMDFSMMGNARLMMYLSDILPFFNARMQGLNKLGRSIRDNPKLIAQRGGAIALASVGLALLNADDERYEELPDNEKDLYWHIFLGDEHFRIPKPFEIGVMFGTIPERMTRTFITDNDSGKKLTERIMWGIGETLSMNPVPQVVKPGMEVFFNYDMFRAAPIESMSDLNVRPEARYNENTSETLRAVGDMTGMSPKKMEHLVRGYFGTLGMWVMGIADMVTRNVSSEYGDAPAWRKDDIAIVGSFYRGNAPAKSTQFMTEFYDVLQKADQLNSTVRQYRQEGRHQEADAILSDEKNMILLRQRKSLTGIQKQIRQLKAQIELVQRDRSLSSTEKRERIDRMMAARNKLVSQSVKMTNI